MDDIKYLIEKLQDKINRLNAKADKMVDEGSDIMSMKEENRINYVLG